MASPLLRLREYVEAANLVRQRVQSERNVHTKEILQEIERSYHRLVEIEKWAVRQQHLTRRKRPTKVIGVPSIAAE